MQFSEQDTNSFLIGTQSKTRKKLLQQSGFNFKYLSPNIEEEKILLNENILPSKQAMFLAYAKACAICEKIIDKNVICFDTTVHVTNKTIFKSTTKDECMKVLLMLNNRTHFLYTACIIMKNKKLVWSYADAAKITFKNNSRKTLEDYIDRHFNKIVNSVGCYNIESEGQQVIDKIEGSYYSILGVPLIPLFRIIKKLK